MIAFGCSIIMPDVYEQRARPGIERAAEPDSVVLAQAAAGSAARGLNLLLDRAAALPDLEALVVVHEDAELLDADLGDRVRRALADEAVALAGAVGVRGDVGMAWWDGQVTWSSAVYRYGELGGGELAFGRSAGQVPGPVDGLYGVVLVFSPWAVAHLRADESIGMLHGVDADLCARAREAGRAVVAADLNVAHHHSLDLVTQIEIWVGAHVRAAERAEDPMRERPDAEWRGRARRAEAEAAAARLLAASRLLQADAVARRDADRLRFMRHTRSWRMTESLRRGNALARRVRGRLAGRR